jgi:hypothetical protein
MLLYRYNDNDRYGCNHVFINGRLAFHNLSNKEFSIVDKGIREAGGILVNKIVGDCIV